MEFNRFRTKEPTKGKRGLLLDASLKEEFDNIRYEIKQKHLKSVDELFAEMMNAYKAQKK